MQAAGLGQGGGDLVGDVLDPRGEVVLGFWGSSEIRVSEASGSQDHS